MDPTPETLSNRRADMELLRAAAIRGNKLTLETEAIMGIAEQSGLFINTPIDYADDEDGWDDVRPF